MGGVLVPHGIACRSWLQPVELSTVTACARPSGTPAASAWRQPGFVVTAVEIQVWGAAFSEGWEIAVGLIP